MFLLSTFCIPAFAMPVADRNEKAPQKLNSDEIIVYVTVAVRGTIARTDDETLMVQVPLIVKDTDQNGVFTVEEALTQLHEKYCPGGFSTHPEKCGPVIDCLWGVKENNKDFYINNEKGFALRDELHFYDQLYAFSYVENWKDPYLFFEKSDDSTVLFRDYTVRLYRADPVDKTKKVPVANAKLYRYNQKGNLVSLNAVTDQNGEATFFFDKRGDYLLTARVDGEIIVPPVMTLHVAGGILSMIINPNLPK